MKSAEKPILFMNPVFKEMVWGGSRLRTEFHYKIPGDDTGECWGISGHPHGDCTVREGTYQGIHLSEIWRDHQELFGHVDCDRFPILTKIIEAKTDLSVQVHPDNKYAMEHEDGSWGKTESWYVLDCKEDTSLIIGHNAKTRDELAAMIHAHRWDDMMRLVPIHKGDFIQLNPGTVHTIKAGTLILETQQNSDITYRVYDYDRLTNGKLRELHVDKSIDVITVPAEPIEDHIRNVLNLPPNYLNLLIDCGYYKVWKMNVINKAVLVQDKPFLIMSIVDGEGTIDGHPIVKGEHFIIPYAYGEYTIEGTMEIIASSL